MTTTALATKRLFLLPPTPKDIRQQIDWLNDPEVVKYSEQRHKKHDLRSQCEYLDSMAPPNHLWAIHTEDWQIGTISARVDRHNSVADLGILIGDRSRWGKGFGLEAWKAVMDYLFASGIRKIEAGHIERNERMAGICFKSGMELEGRRYQHFDLGNYEYSTMILWGKLNWQ
jgi:RimJ/RimL family protein N-acetyltransferase